MFLDENEFKDFKFLLNVLERITGKYTPHKTFDYGRFGVEIFKILLEAEKSRNLSVTINFFKSKFKLKNKKKEESIKMNELKKKGKGGKGGGRRGCK